MALHPLYDHIVIEEQGFANPNERDLARVRQVVDARLPKRHDFAELFDIEPPPISVSSFFFHGTPPSQHLQPTTTRPVTTRFFTPHFRHRMTHSLSASSGAPINSAPQRMHFITSPHRSKEI